MARMEGGLRFFVFGFDVRLWPSGVAIVNVKTGRGWSYLCPWNPYWRVRRRV